MTLFALNLSTITLNVNSPKIDQNGSVLSLTAPIPNGLAASPLRIWETTESTHVRSAEADLSTICNDNISQKDRLFCFSNLKFGIDITLSGSLRRGSIFKRHEYAPIEITIFNNTNNKSISKHIFLNDEKKVVSDGSHCAMSRGTAQRFVCSSAQEFADKISHLPPHAAISLGRLCADLGDSAPLVAEKYLNSAKQGTISRTQKYIDYRKGAPAVVLLDFDQKAMTPANKKRLEELGGFEGAIAHIIDGYSEVARVIRRSTSSGLYNSETGEIYGDSGGLHLYLFVADGDDIERTLEVLQQRAWLLGLGWIYISAAGSLLVRSIIDVSVGTPERLVFEGSPTLDQPLAQRERPADATEGALLDTRKALQNLSSVEKQEFERLVAEAKRAAKPDAEKVVKKAIEKAVKEAVANGIPEARARAAAEKTYSSNSNRVLLSTQRFLFDNPEIGTVTGADILANPSRFDGETLADPLEVNDAGGFIMLNRAVCTIGKQHGDVLIYSQLHGGLRYILRHDLESLREIIQRTPKESLVAAFIRALVAGGADSPVSHSDESILVGEVAKKSGAGKRAINTEIAEARQKRNSSQKSAEPQPQASAEQDNETGAGDRCSGFRVQHFGIPKRLLTPQELIRDYAILVPRGGSSYYVSRSDFQTITDLDLSRRLADAVVHTGQRDGIPIYTPAFKYFTGNADRHKYYDTAFTNKPLPETTLNLFKGLGVAPRKGCCERLLTHINEVICSSDDANYTALINLMAWQMQNIGTPSRIIVGLISKQQQVGKSLFLEMLLAIFGPSGRKIDHMEQITGRFNDPIRGAALILMEELLFHGDKKASNALKGLCTARTAGVESKGLATINIPIGLNIWFTSNHDDAAFLEEQDDRYWIITVSDHRHGDHEYFSALVEEMDDGGVAAFADYLLNLDVSGFQPWRDVPKKNAAKQQMIRASINPYDARVWLEASARAGVVLGLYQSFVVNEVDEQFGWIGGGHAADIKITMASGGREWVDTGKFDQALLLKAYTNWQATVRSAIRPIPTPDGSFGEALLKAGFRRERDSTGDRKWKSILPSRKKCLEALGVVIDDQLAKELEDEGGEGSIPTDDGVPS